MISENYGIFLNAKLKNRCDELWICQMLMLFYTFREAFVKISTRDSI